MNLIEDFIEENDTQYILKRNKVRNTSGYGHSSNGRGNGMNLIEDFIEENDTQYILKRNKVRNTYCITIWDCTFTWIFIEANESINVLFQAVEEKMIRDVK